MFYSVQGVREKIERCARCKPLLLRERAGPLLGGYLTIPLLKTITHLKQRQVH